LLTVGRGKVVATEGGDGERVILEDGKSRHSKVHILTWRPFDLGGNGDLDGVLREEGHGGFFAY